MDVACQFCKGSGLRHLQAERLDGNPGVGKDPSRRARELRVDSEVHRFAWGMGPHRIAITRHGIPDIRLFLESDVRFLRSSQGAHDRLAAVGSNAARPFPWKDGTSPTAPKQVAPVDAVVPRHQTRRRAHRARAGSAQHPNADRLSLCVVDAGGARLSMGLRRSNVQAGKTIHSLRSAPRFPAD